jgi:hypothetical protein
VVLGVVLFDERLQLGRRTPFEVVALGPLVAGCGGLSRSPLLVEDPGGEEEW